MNNVCTSAGGVLGTKTGQQCLESVTTKLILSKEDFKFDSVTDFGLKAKWQEEISNGNLVPLFDIYEFANANTEAAYYESLNFKKETAKAVKVYNAEAYLDFCSHSILKSYENSEYNRVFEVTQDGFIIGVTELVGTETKVKGQLIKSFDVGIRNNATKDKVPFTPIVITFADYEELEDNPVIVDPDFNPNMDLIGIQQVKLTIVSASTSSIVVMAGTYCGGEFVSGLDVADFKVVDSSGSTITPSGVTEDAIAGTYALAGTYATGEGTIMLDGLVPSATALYKSKETSFTAS